MSNIREFLDFSNLVEYDKLIKEYIANTCGDQQTVTNTIQQLTEIAEQTAANNEAIETLMGTGDGSVAKW